MSSVPIRIDGIGTRKSGTTSAITSSNPAELANTASYQRFVRLYASEAIAKGDVLCFDFANTTGTSTGVQGFGNHVKIVAADTMLTSQAIGVAAEANADGDLGRVQVGGYCDYAKADGSETAPGALLIGGNATDSTNGLFVPIDTSEDQGSGGEGDQLPCAILIYDDGADEADSKVWLLNPANL